MFTNSEAWSKTAKGYLKLSQKITLKHGINTIEVTGLKTAIEENKKLRVLDIACGPGDLGIEIAKLATENKTDLFVTSTDFAEDMISLAKENSKQFNNLNECLVMDGNKLEFGDSTFDFTYSMFGVFFFPERKNAMKEIYRTLKQGGKAAITFWKDFPHVMKETMEEFGMESHGSHGDINNEELIIADLKESGFEKVEIVKSEVDSYFEDFEDLFNGVISNPGILGLLFKLSEEDKERFLGLYRKHMLIKFSKDGKSANFSTCGMIAIASK
eukprot:gene8537-361_t